jgi:hypothetical protein
LKCNSCELTKCCINCCIVVNVQECHDSNCDKAKELDQEYLDSIHESRFLRGKVKKFNASWEVNRVLATFC